MILLALSAAWLVGVGLGAAGFGEGYLLALPAGVGVAAGLILTGRHAWALLALGATGLFLLGSLRFEEALPSRPGGSVAAFNDTGRVAIAGVVDREPERRETSQHLVLRVQAVDPGDGWRPAGGRVAVTLRPFPQFAYGDRLQLAGKLESPPPLGSFDSAQYLARKGIGSTSAFPEVRRLDTGAADSFTAALIAIRARLGDALSDALPEPEAALARGMLLGQRTAIPADLTQDFNRAGISHLIAISGSNVTIVAELVLSSLAWLIGRRRAAVAAMLFIVGFVMLVGASPSVVRAGVMGVMMLGAVIAGRPGSALTAVAFAAALLTALQPLAILDVSFQLSFAATLGLIVLEPRLRDWLTGLTPVRAAGGLGTALAESVAVTTAASLAVFPITAANFERVSLIAVPANIVAVPLFTATIVLSALTSICGPVSAQAADVAGACAFVPLWLLIEIADRFAAVPYASVHLAARGLTAATLLYAALGLLALASSRWRPRLDLEVPRLRVGMSAIATPLALAAGMLVWADVARSDAPYLRVSVMDVGQGDSILIVTPAGQRILIDGGPSGAVLLRDLDHELPRGERRIDLMVLTHPQEDHIAGLVDVLDRYRVRQVAVSGITSTIGAYPAWREAVGREGVAPETVFAGESADLGHGVHLDVLSPALPYLTGTEDDLNNNAVVLRLTYGNVSFLLTADLGPEGEARLLAQSGDPHATVLKVGHHGSETSSTQAFLDAVQPAVAVISLGADNTYGHPSPSTLLRLAGVPLYRTDRNGTLRFQTDGERLFVRPERGEYQLVPLGGR